MKRKGLLIVGLAALMALGTGSTAMAAAGWATENGKWVFYDNSGYRVTDEWKRGADNQWRYLDGYGQMAVDRWVDDTYYVDSNGIMAAGKWMQLGTNARGYTTDSQHWYYFLESGKAVINGWKKINNRWYHFDGDGMMETGWVDDNMSYAREDGAAVVGWNKLYPPSGEEEESDPFAEDDDRRWYYFSSTGKKFVPELTGDAKCGEKRIDGNYYCFNSNGAMQTGWAYVGGGGGGNTIEGYRFYDSSGKAVTGWYSAMPPNDLRGYENEVEWFYFSKSGVPKVGPAKGTGSSTDFLRINGKNYLFNELGTPVTGLQKVYVNKSGGEYTAYYFDPNTCAALSGKINVDEGDGNRCQYYFATSGKGFTGVQNGSLYYMGKLQTADSDTKYEVITMPGTNGKSTNYVINSSGKVMKNSSSLRVSDGTKYTTDKNGVLTKINGESIGSGMTFSEPREPVWN